MKMRMWMAVAMIVGLAITWLPGCSVYSTGPKVAETIGEGSMGLAKALVTQYQPEQMNAGVDGKINDPRYRCKTFVGTGVYVDIILSLEGADLGFDVKSWGKGVEVPTEVRERAVAIMGDAALSEQQRTDVVGELVIGWLQSPAAPGKPLAAGDAP